MKKNKKYMVAIQATITLNPVVYVEVKAKNKKDSIKKAAWARGAAIKKYHDDFINEAAVDLKDVVIKKVKLIPAGKSSQFYYTGE
jgi:hypothetical protein